MIMTKEYPMTESEFIKRVSELFMETVINFPQDEKKKYIKSEEIIQFMKELYKGMCGRYDYDGWDDAFTDEMLLSVPVHNLELYF